MIADGITKVCSRCKETKPLNAFSPKERRCRECEAARTRARINGTGAAMLSPQPEELSALSAPEQEQLRVLEQTIEDGLQTFLDVGTALLVVRDSRLYRQQYGTFEEYCRTRWGMGRSRVYQMIDAAAVVDNLKMSTIVDILPSHESQARPLAKLEPEQQVAAWSDAVAGATDGKPTAKQVQKAAATFAPKPAPQPEPDAPSADELAAIAIVEVEREMEDADRAERDRQRAGQAPADPDMLHLALSRSYVRKLHVALLRGTRLKDMFTGEEMDRLNIVLSHALREGEGE